MDVSSDEANLLQQAERDLNRARVTLGKEYLYWLKNRNRATNEELMRIENTLIEAKIGLRFERYNLAALKRKLKLGE